MITAIVFVIGCAIAFYVGKEYGVEVEQEAIAELTKLEGDAAAIVASIKARVEKAL